MMEAQGRETPPERHVEFEQIRKEARDLLTALADQINEGPNEGARLRPPSQMKGSEPISIAHPREYELNAEPGSYRITGRPAALIVAPAAAVRYAVDQLTAYPPRPSPPITSTATCS
jgi:hypothetical protein